MSNKPTKTPISEATNVAEDINNNNGLENIIRSEFIIVSDNEKSETEDRTIASNKVLVVPVTEKRNENINTSQNQSILQSSAANTKKISTKDSNKKKGGPNTRMINLIKQQQDDLKVAELEAKIAAEEELRLEEQRKQVEEEKLRAKKEHQEKKKLQKRKRIERKRHEGSYLTKTQREKHQRDEVQLKAAGIQIPAHNITQSTTSNNSEVRKKPILYDDYRKTNITASDVYTESDVTLVDSRNNIQTDEEDSSSDSWEKDSVDETIYSEKRRTLSTTEDSSSDNQKETRNHTATNQESSESESTEDEDDNSSLSPMERVQHRLERYHNLCESRRSSEVLRAPVICVLGHVDAGKTTMLDNLRRTHVQDNEAGGITQQIGATNVPSETINERTKMCRKIISREGDIIVPGLLIIDTPGHEIFKNLRSRGSSLCDVAILVVDLMSGLEKQTLESIKLLTERKTPFIIALNKVDRLYNWKSDNKKDIELVLQEQTQNTRHEFEKRCNDIFVQFAEQGLNVALYYKNPNPNEYYSMVPTSARTGDGMGSLIATIIETCQTSLDKRISYTDELQATVMEVKSNNNFGTTIDVVLVNGCLTVGDKIIIAGQEGPIVTHIQALFIPESNQELRVTNQYEKNKKVQGTRGIKIRAKDLEKSMAGLPLFVARKDDEIEYFKNEIETILQTVLNSIQLKDKGVYVQASTLGSLEALLEFLKQSKIPYAGINIGPVHRKDVIRASAQLEKDVQWATILAFDVTIERDAQEYADSVGVKILHDDQFYNLCKKFISVQEQIKTDNQEKHRHLAVFPCKLKILPQYVFNKRDPIVCGVRVEDGFVKLGTPICIPSKDHIAIGRVVSIEKNHKSLDSAPKGSEVCIRIEPITGETPKMYGRHFDHEDLLISKISRESIDVVKAYFRDDMNESDWQLILKLKKIFNIV